MIFKFWQLLDVDSFDHWMESQSLGTRFLFIDLFFFCSKKNTIKSAIVLVLQNRFSCTSVGISRYWSDTDLNQKKVSVDTIVF